MSIEIKDINLETFLRKFTFTNEPGKIQIDTALFMQIATLLKIDLSLDRLRRNMSA